jgi:hypothetical protein
MSEGFSKRMARIVGDQNTVARYLLEKCAHTTMITFAFACVFIGYAVPDPLGFYLFKSVAAIAILAAITYDVIGKILYIRDRNPAAPFLWGGELEDALFDFWVGLWSFAASFALWHWYLFFPAVALWLAGVAIGSNNQFGTPS